MRAEIKRVADAVDAGAREDGLLRVAIETLRAQNDMLFEACARLERERVRYHDLYVSAPDALVTTDERSTIVEANPATARVLNFPHETLPGKLLIGFVARGDTNVFRGRVRALVGGHGSQEAFSVRMRPRGGRPFLAELSVRVVRSQLEPTVALHWNMRVDGSKHPNEGDVYDLLETAADELRAPVTTTLGWSRLLHDGALSAQELPPAFAALTESALAEKALLDQIAELVALARESEPATAVSLVGIVAQAAERTRPAALSRNVLFEVEQLDGDPRTCARAGHLAWALDRLLAQAVQAASSPGTVHVQVGSSETHATLRVFATGAPTLGGSRLAVAVARAAIERQAGTLRVPELAEDGVVLEVRLPLASS
jgi:PAS domain S-box-containing protein